MYSRSLDNRRTPTALPSHYGGSAFRADGTPTPIPVKREYDLHPKSADSRDPRPPERSDKPALPPQDIEAETPIEAESLKGGDTDVSIEASPSVPKADKEKDDGAFLSRLLDGILPGVREDDLLLLLLILLLSREKGNEDALVLLAYLLLAK